MKINLEAFTNVFLGDLGSWYNWSFNMTRLPENLVKENTLAFKQSCYSFLNVMCLSNGLSREDCFDFCLSMSSEDSWLNQNVDLKTLKNKFFNY